MDEPTWRKHPESLRLFKHLTAMAESIGLIENLHKPDDRGRYCTECSSFLNRLLRRTEYPCKTILATRKASAH